MTAKSSPAFSLNADGEKRACPAGENHPQENLAEGKIPLLSRELPCIHRDIAELGAKIVAGEEPHAHNRRAETFQVPRSKTALWARNPRRVAPNGGKRSLFVSVATLSGMQWAASAAWAQQTGPDYGHHMWGGGWWMFLGPLMMLFFIAAAVAVVVLMVRWLGGSGHGGPAHAPTGKTHVDILNERFARGEIDKEEFEERMRVLSN